MMKIAAIFSCAVVCFLASGAPQAAPKYYPQTVPQAEAKQFPPPGYSRFKISVSLNDAKVDDGVIVGNLSICSDKACYRPEMPNKRIGLYNTSSGKAELIYEVVLPDDEIKSVHFDEVAGGKVVVGDLNLSTTLKLDSERAQGGEILVLVKKKQGGNRVVYYPESSAVGFYHPEINSVYYNPAFAAAVKLKMGVEWDIAVRALAAPQIFLANVHNTGDVYPMVDLHPEVGFMARSSLLAKPLRKPVDASSSFDSIRKSVKKTGLFRFDEEESQIKSQESVSSASAASWVANCVAFVSQYIPTITSSMKSTGAVYFRKCETVPPYVHIAIGDNADAREIVGIAYDSLDSTGLLALQRIETFAGNSQIMINGFSWVGDRGYRPGTGFARGFVQRNSKVLGSNRENGGISGAAGLNQLAVLLQPRTQPKWKEAINGPLWTNGVDGVSLPYSVVSSSTSIIKNGVCTTDSDINRWSAFGVTPDNKVIFMSSTSSGSASAAELCEVFRAFGATDALRMDGNSAAGMTIDGQRVNPLTNTVDAAIYGESRYVAYGLGMAFINGATPPATPVIGGQKSIPSNPCKVDPTRCQ
jgi:hypothetical protein